METAVGVSILRGRKGGAYGLQDARLSIYPQPGCPSSFDSYTCCRGRVIAMTDPLCVCGHRASHHDTPDTGDIRCLAVEARDDLLEVFDDDRDTAYAYCACLRFTEARPDPNRGSR